MELAAEIRLHIYSCLFEGQTVCIRPADDLDEQRRLWYERRVSLLTDPRPPSRPFYCSNEFARDKAMGLNILFASKTCLAEAKPVLLAKATFDIDFDAWFSHYAHQGFSAREIQIIRSLKYIVRRDWRPCSLCTYSLETLAAVERVEIACYEIFESSLPFDKFESDRDLHTLKLLILDVKKPPKDLVHKNVLRHMRKGAERGQRAQVILKYRLRFPLGEVDVSVYRIPALTRAHLEQKLCVDLISQTVWVERYKLLQDNPELYDIQTVRPKRTVPTVLSWLENVGQEKKA